MQNNLTIKNFGPIKSLHIRLNQFNLFIGLQSSGKSTIAKIISFCKWMEKHWLINADTSLYNKDFVDSKLIAFHNFENYITPDSFFSYETENIKIIFRNNSLSVEGNVKLENIQFEKISYIPAERNLISLPGLYSFKQDNTYIRDFMQDWFDIREKYSGSNLEILNLGCKYSFNKSSNAVEILLPDQKVIKLSQASSGLQSVTPLVVMIDYLTRWIFENEEKKSPESLDQKSKAYSRILTDALLELGSDYRKKLKDILSSANVADIPSLNKLIENDKNAIDPENLSEYYRITNLLTDISEFNLRFDNFAYSNIVIEEPEQNLFPETQVDLVYYILEKINHSRDFITITTHSPYILYALNNAMLSFQVRHNENLQSMDIDVPEKAFLDPSKVSVWEIRNGTVSEETRIQDESGLVSGNYFDKVMHNIMADFNNLLSLKMSYEHKID